MKVKYWSNLSNKTVWEVVDPACNFDECRVDDCNFPIDRDFSTLYCRNHVSDLDRGELANDRVFGVEGCGFGY